LNVPCPSLAAVSCGGWDAEVLWWTDGSTDNTAALVELWAKRHPEVRLSATSGNRGKGYKRAQWHAEGGWRDRDVTDADLSSH